ncbi:hypothetical protein [Duganella flavida]|nr:hypothetical protein [Duganella flavida]
MLTIIKAVSSEDRRFKSMEEFTRISGATWRTFWNRNSAPSGEMIESVSERWPQYAFWLATGGTDPLSGHVAPPGAECILEKINEEMPESTEYFMYQMKLLQPLRERTQAGLAKIGVTPDFEKSLRSLMDAKMNDEILKRMPLGAKFFETDSLDSPHSKEYEEVREQVMQDMRDHDLQELEEYRKRKLEAVSR